MPTTRSVLMVLTAADRLRLSDGTAHPTGFDANQLVGCHRRFTEAGWEVAFATPSGTRPCVDTRSLALLWPRLGRRGRRLQAALDDLAPALDHPLNLGDIGDIGGDDLDSYDLVLYLGGLGAIEDLAADPVSGALLISRLDAGRPLALLGEGCAAVLAATRGDGANAFAGHQMTGPSREEQLLWFFSDRLPWVLEDRLAASAIGYQQAKALFRPHVVVDRGVFTGQNGPSTGDLVTRVLAEV